MDTIIVKKRYTSARLYQILQHIILILGDNICLPTIVDFQTNDNTADTITDTITDIADMLTYNPIFYRYSQEHLACGIKCLLTNQPHPLSSSIKDVYISIKSNNNMVNNIIPHHSSDLIPTVDSFKKVRLTPVNIPMYFTKLTKNIYKNDNTIIKIGSYGDYDYIIRDIALIKHLSHPNIINIKGFRVSSNNTFYTMKYVPYTLNENVTPHSIDYVYKQLVSAVKYIHSRGIVHGDLKPDNIMIDDNYHITIIDFDVSTIYNSRNVMRMLGTYPYAPLDLLEKHSDDNYLFEFGYEYDIWSIGMVMLELYIDFNIDHDIPHVIEYMQQNIVNSKLECIDDGNVRERLLCMLDTNPNTRHFQ